MSGAAVLVTLAAAVIHACWNELLAHSGDAHARTAVGMLIGAAAFLPVALSTSGSSPDRRLAA